MALLPDADKGPTGRPWAQVAVVTAHANRRNGSRADTTIGISKPGLRQANLVDEYSKCNSCREHLQKRAGLSQDNSW